MLKKYLFLPFLFLLLPFLSLAQLKVGDKAPKIHIGNWIKNTPASKELSGKFVIIDFWATWCAPCLESVPHMNTLVEKHKNKTNVVFLAMTDEVEKKVSALLNRVVFSSAVVSDVSRETFDNYQIKTIPHCVIIDDKNIVKWEGNPVNLTDETLSAILDGKEAPEPATVVETTNYRQDTIPTQVKDMYASTSKDYFSMFKDKGYNEYFAMKVSSYPGGRASTSMIGPNIYNEVMMSAPLGNCFAKLLNVSGNQVILPPNVASTYISYCYKSERNTSKQDVLNAILKEVNMRYQLTDSLEDAILLDITDVKTFRSYEGNGYMAHASNSESYIGLDNSRFVAVKQAIEDKFQKTVIVRQEDMLDEKVSMTIQVADMETLIKSLKLFGIQASAVKAKIPVYKFTRDTGPELIR